MTATSPMPFPTMDTQIFDDTMEMGSPYHGQADDFEIDLDAMEDQASNTDNDVMVADAYPEASEDAARDTADDADMVDDAAQPAFMDDAYDQPPETNRSADVKNQVEESFEAEMEDEYEEDIDAPVSGYQEEVPANVDGDNGGTEETHLTEKNEDVEDEAEGPVTDSHSETRTDRIDDNTVGEIHSASVQGEYNDTKDGAGESPEHEGNPSQEKENYDNTNKADTTDTQSVHAVENADDTVHLKEPETDVPEVAERESPAVESRVQETGFKDAKGVYESDEGETNLTEHPPALHTVKVLYQDNEISLFPPQEGDYSETFFLEDEGVAYQDFEKFFGACREVLGEHLGENEILVADIDSVDVQLLEDSVHTSKVTLHQIIDLYLQLSHNDGIEMPEPLYLTLSTRLTLPSHISGLVEAANDGKGLSELFSWNEYDEGKHDTEEAKEDDQKPDSVLSPQDSEDRHKEKELDKGVSGETNSDDHIQDSDRVRDEGAVEEAPDVRKDDAPTEGVVESEDAEKDDGPENIEHHIDEHNQKESGVEDHGNLAPGEGQYDSEERKTESSATLSNLAASQLSDEQNGNASTEAAAGGKHEGHGRGNEAESHDDTGPEDETEQFVSEHGYHSESLENDDTSAVYDEVEQTAETNEGGPTSQHEEERTEEVKVVESSGSAASEEHPPPSREGDVNSTLNVNADINSSGAPQQELQETTEPAEDLLGVGDGDDLLKSPGKGTDPRSTAHVQEEVDDWEDDFDDGEIREDVEQSQVDEHAEDGEKFQDIGHTSAGEQSEDGKILEETEPQTTSQPEGGKDNDFDPTLDNDDYIDLGFTESLKDAGEAEEPGLQSPDRQDSVSTKRFRDEFEPAEEHTPDLKRSRCS